MAIFVVFNVLLRSRNILVFINGMQFQEIEIEDFRSRQLDMRNIPQHELELLKQMVLITARINAITPAIFKDLSTNILLATKRQVSNSTLKRIFGFAAYKFQPSLYTLNVLSEYCGFNSWIHFSASKKSTLQNQQLSYESEASGTDLQLKLLEWSQYTLQVLKNKSGIPFSLTIPRDLLHEHLEIFIHNPYPATVVTAPAGYGKTIGLCHWVEEQLNSLIKLGKDIILFTNNKTLNRIGQHDELHQLLLSLAGITTNSPFTVQALQNHLRNHKIYLIIDSSDTTSPSNGQFSTILNILLNAIANHQNTNNLKVILTMRPSDWMEFRRQLIAENKIDQWFFGFMTDERNERNFPPFSPHELKLLADKLNPGINLNYDTHSEVFTLFSYPPFVQYYYQKNSKRFFLNQLDVFDMYDVVHSNILDKIYTGRHNTEKVLLINTILEKGRYYNGSFCTDKLKVYEDIKTHKVAYQDLLSLDILSEINYSDESGYHECIEFVNDRILSHSITVKLIYDNDNSFDKELINKINRHNDLKLQIIKWCIYIAIKNKQYSIFTYLHHLLLPATEKSTLILFLSKLIDKGLLTNNDGIEELPFDVTQPELFNFFFGMEFISPDYEKVLTSLLKLKVQNTSKIWIHCCLGIIHLISLNADGVENCLASLKKFSSEDYLIFQINPLSCLETIYYFLKFRIIKKEALSDITKFSLYPYLKRHQLNKISSNHILYLLALSTLSISGNSRKIIRFINTLHNIHHSNDLFLPEFHILLLISKANALLDLGKNDDAVNIFNLIMADFSDNEKNFTTYMKAYLELLASRLLPYTSDHTYIETSVMKMANWHEKEHVKMLQVNTLSYYLNYKVADRLTVNYQTLYFKFLKIMRSTSFDPRSFVINHNYFQ